MYSVHFSVFECYVYIKRVTFTYMCRYPLVAFKNSLFFSEFSDCNKCVCPFTDTRLNVTY